MRQMMFKQLPAERAHGGHRAFTSRNADIEANLRPKNRLMSARQDRESRARKFILAI